jgi:hypothetical protein
MIEIIGMAPRDRNCWPFALRRAEQVVLLGLVVAAPFACKREVAPAPPPQTAPPAASPIAATPAEKPSPDAKAALAWLETLRERDPGALLEKTALPFDFRDADAHKKKCGTRLAATKAAAKDVATCLALDPRFHADLSATPEPRLIALDAADAFPPWTKSWVKTMAPGLRALSTFVHGESDARELVVLVGDDGVRGLWQQLTIEPK